MRSMTGYGHCESTSLDGIKISVEIRTVNRKQLDIKFNLPKELQAIELEIRRLISLQISRGSVYVKIDIELGTSILSQSTRINTELAENYIRKAEELRNSTLLPGRLKIKDILLLPGVVEQVEPDFVTEKLKLELFNTLSSALSQLKNSRKEEGQFLKEDILKRLELMDKLILEIEPLVKKLPEYYKDKLQRRLEEENLGNIDDERMLREIVIYTDKCDVSEEITRLESHLSQFKSMLSTEDIPVGRKLDFITQEIQREINTLGVKAANVEISPKVVIFKTEAEKVREQIQNVE